MRKCPFCAEEIQDEAVKCKHCGEYLNKNVAADSKEASIGEKTLLEAKPALISYLGYFILGILGIAAIGLGLLLILWIFLDRASKRYIITDKRVIVRRGILAKHTDEIEIVHIRNINIRQSIAARLFGYGNILMGTSGTAGIEIVIERVASPEKVRGLIRSRLV